MKASLCLWDYVLKLDRRKLPWKFMFIEACICYIWSCSILHVAYILYVFQQVCISSLFRSLLREQGCLPYSSMYEVYWAMLADKVWCQPACVCHCVSRARIQAPLYKFWDHPEAADFIFPSVMGVVVLEGLSLCILEEL